MAHQDSSREGHAAADAQVHLLPAEQGSVKNSAIENTRSSSTTNTPNTSPKFWASRSASPDHDQNRRLENACTALFGNGDGPAPRRTHNYP